MKIMSTMLVALLPIAVMAASHTVMDLESVAHSLALQRISASSTSRVYASSAGRVEFSANSRRIILDGVLVWLNAGVTANDTGWSIASKDYHNTLVPILDPGQIKRSGASPGTVVLDPGHGGSDTGAKRGGQLEKLLVMDIAARVTLKLRERAYDVKLTRAKDVFISLADRNRCAKTFGGDLLVSIHLNASGNPDAQGLETYVVPGAGFPSTAKDNSQVESMLGNKNDAFNMLAAYLIHKSVLETVECPDRGVKRARFNVLRDASCPAVLVECGFMSNQQEGALLFSSGYRDKIANGLALGIINYLNAVGFVRR